VERLGLRILALLVVERSEVVQTAVQNRRAPDPACPVLRPPACRKLLDTAPLPADRGPCRAARVAPDLIWSTVQRAEARAAGATRWRCLCMARSDDQPEQYGVAPAPGFARRTAINLWGRVNRALNELTDGTVCSVDAVTGAEIGPYRNPG
jgi:hypothetical protein